MSLNGKQILDALREEGASSISSANRTSVNRRLENHLRATHNLLCATVTNLLVLTYSKTLKMLRVSMVLVLALVLSSCERDLSLADDPACQWYAAVQSPEGFTYEELGPLPADVGFRSLHFINEKIMYLYGSTLRGGLPIVAKTLDGGLTWSDVAPAGFQGVKGADFFDEQVGVVATTGRRRCINNLCLPDGQITVTRDGGFTWQTVFVDSSGLRTHNPAFDATGTLYVYQGNQELGQIIRSSDLGQTWDTLFSSGLFVPSTTDFSFSIQDSLIYCAARQGTELLVIDTAGNFLYRSNPDVLNIRDVVIAEDGSLLVSGSAGLVSSSDQGRSWQPIIGGRSNIIAFRTATEGMIVSTRASCPTDTPHSSDYFAVVSNSRLVQESLATLPTTNLSNTIADSHLHNGSFYLLLRNRLAVLRPL